MEIRVLTIAFVASIVLLGCSGSKKVQATNPDLDEMISAKKIEFRATAAQPFVTNALSQFSGSGLLPPGSTVGRIDLNGRENFLKIEGDSVSANLPFYGERRMGGGYNNDTGFNFEGKLKDMKIVKEENNKSYRISFQINKQTEVLNVRFQLFRSLAATMTIVSTQRTNMGYTGTVRGLEEE